MALVLRGVAEAASADGADVTVTLPGGTTTDDLVIVAWSTGGIGASDSDMTVSTSGYTEVADLYQANTSNNINLGVAYKLMGATPDTTVVCTGKTSYATIAVVSVWTGADLTTPLDATTTTAVAGSAAPDSPSITTVTNNAIVLSIGTSGVQDAAVTAPTGYSDQADIDTNNDGATVCVASKLKTTAGAENPAAWTNWATISRDSMAAASVAIRPAGEVADTLFAQSIM